MNLITFSHASLVFIYHLAFPKYIKGCSKRMYCFDFAFLHFHFSLLTLSILCCPSCCESLVNAHPVSWCLRLSYPRTWVMCIVFCGCQFKGKRESIKIKGGGWCAWDPWMPFSLTSRFKTNNWVFGIEYSLVLKTTTGKWKRWSAAIFEETGTFYHTSMSYCGFIWLYMRYSLCITNPMLNNWVWIFCHSWNLATESIFLLNPNKRGTHSRPSSNARSHTYSFLMLMEI